MLTSCNLILDLHTYLCKKKKGLNVELNPDVFRVYDESHVPKVINSCSTVSSELCSTRFTLTQIIPLITTNCEISLIQNT